MAHLDTQSDDWKRLAGSEAAKLVTDGMRVGLGTGTTANHFIQALALRIQEGLRIVGAVSSSLASQQLATQLDIPITTLDSYPELDLYVDGADEIDPHLQLIKGAGGALLREKVVAAAARRFVVVADVSKRVPQLGLHFPVPVEVVPFGVTPVRKRLEALGAIVKPRQMTGGSAFLTDNHNMILDCTFPDGITDPAELDAHLHSIVGIVETGLFLNMAQEAILGGPEGIQHMP